MKIIATADIHGYLPIVNACDIFTISGDLFPNEMDRAVSWQKIWFESSFLPWIETLPCKYVIITPGNHDYFFQKNNEQLLQLYDGSHHPITSAPSLIYLCDTGICIEGVSFYGIPWVPMPTRNKAFYLPPEELYEKFMQVPDNLDILLSHASPCVGNLGFVNDLNKDIGSVEMVQALTGKHINYILCGHIHSGNHEKVLWNGTICYNLSFCNSQKQPFYPVVEINL